MDKLVDVAKAGAELIAPLLTVPEAANLLRLSPSFLNKRRLDGTGPIYMKVGRRILYDRSDLVTWARNTKRRHTSEVA